MRQKDRKTSVKEKENKRKSRIILLIIRYFILFLLAAVIGISFFYSIGARIGNRPAPMPFGVGVSVVLSGSMEGDMPDSLDVGDLIFYTKAEEYNVGDVVVYPDGKITVVHRIIFSEGDYVITQGDANDSADSPIESRIIYGKVRGSVHYAGYVALWLKSPMGIVLTIVAAALLIELSNRSSKKKKLEETEQIRREIEKLKQDGKKPE